MSTGVDPVAGKAARAATVFVALSFGLVCFAGLWRVVATIGLQVPFDPNEGWNAYHAVAAMSGHALYPDARSYMVDNYPPLSFYLVGTFGRIVGDDIVAGRIVSLVSFLAVAAAIVCAARRMGCGRIEAALAALFFMVCLVVGSDYVGMDDPQLLGHALEMAGFLLLTGANRRPVLSALLFAVALFVKHNLFAMPLAASVWLALFDRTSARRFAAAGVAFLLAGLLLFRFVYGTDLLSHLASPRLYSLSLLESGVAAWLIWSAVPLAALVGLAAVRRNDPLVVLCVLYAGIAVTTGVAFSGGGGVDANVFFDADIALSLGLGLALDRYRPTWRAAIAVALLLPLFAGIYRASDEDWRDPAFWEHPLADEAGTARADIAFLRAHKGRALCETLSLCYWAGKDAEIDVFNTGQAFATGARPDGDLARRIEERTFASIEFDTLQPFTLTQHLRAALLQAYRVDHADDEGVFLVPRESGNRS